MTEGGSEDGGLEELVEFLLSRSSSSAIRCSKLSNRARRAAWASGGTVCQSGSGMGGGSLMSHGIGDARGSCNTRPLNAYQCHGCRKRFDDLTDTIFAGHHQPLRAWVLCLYLMGLNLSNEQIA